MCRGLRFLRPPEVPKRRAQAPRPVQLASKHLNKKQTKDNRPTATLYTVHREKARELDPRAHITTTAGGAPCIFMGMGIGIGAVFWWRLAGIVLYSNKNNRRLQKHSKGCGAAISLSRGLSTTRGSENRTAPHRPRFWSLPPHSTHTAFRADLTRRTALCSRAQEAAPPRSSPWPSSQSLRR